METFVRAKRPQRLPEVMTRDEVEALFAHMEGVTALMAGLMYGGALRHPHGSGIAGPRRCRDHHDLYARSEQAGAFGPEPG
jgi:hypothetical protein